MPGVTVTAETYGAHDGGPDVIVVRVDDREVGAYCIADDVEEERANMERMVRAIYAAGMREGAKRITMLQQSWRDGGESARTQSDRPRGRRARGRAQILRLLADVASGGWEDEHGRKMSTAAAREAITVLRWSWGMLEE